MSQLLKWSAALAICRHVHAYGGHHDSTLLLVNKCMHANCCNAMTSWQYILSRSQSPTNSQLQLQSYSYSWLSFLYCPHALLTHPMPPCIQPAIYRLAIYQLMQQPLMHSKDMQVQSHFSPINVQLYSYSQPASYIIAKDISNINFVQPCIALRHYNSYVASQLQLLATDANRPEKDQVLNPCNFFPSKYLGQLAIW